MNDKVRENRLRRKAARQGLTLHRSRRRDPHALDYGGYWLVDPQRNAVVYGWGPAGASASLDDIERFLTEGPREPAR